MMPIDITAKQVAQTLYLDEIIIHEIILETIKDLEYHIQEHPISWSRSDIVYKITNRAMNHELCHIFEFSKQDFLDILKNEYDSEIKELISISSNQKK